VGREEGRGHFLDGAAAAGQAEVFGQIDRPHPSAADLPDDTIAVLKNGTGSQHRSSLKSQVASRKSQVASRRSQILPSRPASCVLHPASCILHPSSCILASCTLAHLHTCTLASLHPCILYTCTLAHLYTCILAYLHTCILAHLPTCLLAPFTPSPPQSPRYYPPLRPGWRPPPARRRPAGGCGPSPQSAGFRYPAPSPRGRPNRGSAGPPSAGDG
jgi:hypothetical protein